MPDMLLEVKNDIEIQLPPVNVPMNEGEQEKFGNMLNLDANLRREAQVKELTEALKRLQGTPQGEIMFKYAASPSARRRQVAVRKKHEQLRKLTFKRDDRWQGPCAPATVINMNPVALTLQGELQRWSVPAAGKGQTIHISHNGRKFVASYLTIDTPHLWPVYTGTSNDKQTGLDMPVVDYDYITPLGLATQFYDHFVVGASDAQNMGGIIVFEGDIHTMDKKKLESNKNMIWVPKKEVTLDGEGDIVYTSEPKLLKDVLEQALQIQHEYCSVQIAEGNAYAIAESDIIRNQLSNYHRIWHNYALDQGYIDTPYDWATKKLKTTPAKSVVYCPDCREKQKSPEQYFCSNCNAPFDALKAFFDGKTVSPDRLTVYEGEEWEAIVKETKRRQSKIALLSTPNKLSDVDENTEATTTRRRKKTEEVDNS